MDPVSKFVAGWKIPIGQWGKSFIDFIVTYFQWFFDGLSAVLEWSVEGTTFVLLQIPPVILAIALAGGVYWLRRSRALALATLIGLLFIINQGLWKETVQTLVLVVAATALSMAIGVPHRHLGGAQAAGLAGDPAGARPDADHADLRLPHPHSHSLRPWRRSGADRHHHLRHARTGAHDLSGPHLDPQADAGGGRKFRRHQAPAAVEGGTAGGPALDHGGSHPMHHAVAVDGGVRHPDRRAEPRQSGQQGAGQPQHSARHRGGAGDRHSRHHPRPGACLQHREHKK